MPPVYAGAPIPNTPRLACVYQLLQDQAERTPDALAILPRGVRLSHMAGCSGTSRMWCRRFIP